MSITQLKPWSRRSLFAAAAIVVGAVALGGGSAPAQAQYYPYYPYAYPYAYTPYYPAYYPYAYGYPYWGPGFAVGFSFGGHRHRW